MNATTNEHQNRPLETERGSWAELVSAALVGTDRRAFVPDAAIPSDGDPAQALLRQAMLVAIPALTGARPARYEGPPPEPAPADDRPLIPLAAQLRLRAVLDVYPEYLEEWLTAVRASGRRLPSAAMPGLLEVGRGNAAIRSALAQVLGARGHWLARQNPDWRYLLREPFGPLRAADWDGTDPDARVAYVNGLYAADPAAARELLVTAWPTLTANLKLLLLGLVARHGGKADLPFVKSLAQDSSKQVRDEVRGIEAQLERREEDTPAVSAEEFSAEVARLTAGEGFDDELHRFAARRAGRRWPIEGARVILAALVEYSRETVPDDTGERAAGNRRTRNHWAAEQLLGTLADCAPPELRADVELLVRAQSAETAAGASHRLGFGDLLTRLGFRADMHTELTAPAEAATGQE